MHVQPLSKQEVQKSSLARIQFSCTSQATPKHKTRTARTRGRRNVLFQRVAPLKEPRDAKPLAPMTHSARTPVVPCLRLHERTFELDVKLRGCEKEVDRHHTSRAAPDLSKATVREVALDPEIGDEQSRFQVLHDEIVLAPHHEQLDIAHSFLDPVIVAKLVKSAVLRSELRIIPLLSLPLLLLLLLLFLFLLGPRTRRKPARRSPKSRRPHLPARPGREPQQPRTT